LPKNQGPRPMTVGKNGGGGESDPGKKIPNPTTEKKKKNLATRVPKEKKFPIGSLLATKWGP